MNTEELALLNEKLDRIEDKIDWIIAQSPEAEATQTKLKNSQADWLEAIQSLMVAGRKYHYTAIYHLLTDANALPVPTTEGATLQACNRLVKNELITRVKDGQFTLHPSSHGAEVSGGGRARK